MVGTAPSGDGDAAGPRPDAAQVAAAAVQAVRAVQQASGRRQEDEAWRRTIPLQSREDVASDPMMRARMEKLRKEVRACPRSVLLPHVAHCNGGRIRLTHPRASLSQVDMLARTEEESSASASAATVQVEKLITTNREQARKIDELSRAAAQREADTAQLQIQLAQAKLQASQTAQAMQEAQAQAQAQRSQLIAQHNQMMQQVRALSPERQQPATFSFDIPSFLCFVVLPATTTVLNAPAGPSETAPRRAVIGSRIPGCSTGRCQPLVFLSLANSRVVACSG
jgi:hypothetical protein